MKIQDKTPDKQAPLKPKNITISEQPNITVIAFTRNAMLGMALAYLEALEQIFGTISNGMKVAPAAALSLIHLAIPSMATWFACHWSQPIEAGIFVDSILDSILNVSMLWLIMATTWGMIWTFLSLAIGKAIGVSSGNERLR